jgi:phospholipase C
MRRLALLVVVAACSKSDPAAGPPPEPEPTPDTRPPTPAEWDRSVTRTNEAAASADRAACKFARGALADESLGSEIPVGKDIPIETIVVIMQENRSFDHYFGHFGKYAGRTDVESAPETASNPARAGDVSSATIPYEHAGHYCFLDTAHGWTKSHKQVNGGKMDGFYETNHDIPGEVMPDPTMALRDGARAMWWYDERELPYYYALAKEFAIADHYFASLQGPTWPNRMFFVAATSFGRASNTFPNIDAYEYPNNDVVIHDELEKRHVDWKLYSDGPPTVATVVNFQLATRWAPRDVKFVMSEFYADAAAGKLPPVVWVESNALKNGEWDGDNEHPPAQLQVGQKWTHDVLKALMTGPQWSKMAVFITYDEHGGLYDHVPPPKACKPDDKGPIDDEGQPLEGAFDELGVRVPMLVVSPYAKRGHVSHAVYDHTSILRFIEAKHRVPALTGRDANANIPIDFFDFGAPPNTNVPALPEPPVEDGESAYCKQTFLRSD